MPAGRARISARPAVRVLVAVVLALLVMVAAAVWAIPAGADTPGQVAGVEEPQPVEEPSAEGFRGDDGERTGPDPTGQALPDRGQRVIDTAVWLGLLVTLALAAVLVARTWWRIPQDPPLLGAEPSDRPVRPAPVPNPADGGAGADGAAGGQH